MKSQIQSVLITRFTVGVAAIASLLGLSSCGASTQDSPVEYGTPHATFEIKARVIGDDGKPIAGLSVDLLEAQDSRRVSVSGSTNTDGAVTVEDTAFPVEERLLDIRDIDEDANGDWQDQRVTVRFARNDFKNGHSWFKGKATKEIKVTMVKR